MRDNSSKPLVQTNRTKSSLPLLGKAAIIRQLKTGQRQKPQNVADEIHRYFEAMPNNALEYYDIPEEYQNNKGHHIYRSIHTNSKASRDIVKRFYQADLDTKEAKAFKLIAKTGKHRDLLGERYKSMKEVGPVESVAVEDQGLNKHAIERRDAASVRGLDDWKQFQQTKVKVKPGENRELMLRIFKYAGDHSASYMKKYEEFILRLKITPRELIREIFVWEQAKNDMVLNLLSAEEARLNQEIMTLYTRMHENRNNLMAISREVEELENEGTEKRNKMDDFKELLQKRKDLLVDRGKVPILKHRAIMKKAAAGLRHASEGEIRLLEQHNTLNKEPEPVFNKIPDEPLGNTITGNVEVEIPVDNNKARGGIFAETSVLEQEIQQKSARSGEDSKYQHRELSLEEELQEIDIFEEDVMYSQLKQQHQENKRIVTRNQRTINGLYDQMLELKKLVASIEAQLKIIAEKHKKNKKIKLEFILTTLKYGLDSREYGCVWLMREAVKLGAINIEDRLPEFVDGATQEYLIVKLKVYSSMMDLKEQNEFLLKFFKLMAADESDIDQVAKHVREKIRKKERNPMLEFISETDSITLKPLETSQQSRVMMSANVRAETANTLAQGNGRRPFMTDPALERVQSQTTGIGLVRAPSNIDHLRNQLSASDLIHRQPNEGQNTHRLLESSNFRSQSSLNPLLNGSQRVHDPLLSAKMKSVGSAILTELVSKKQEEFSKRGVVYIGDKQYPFPYDGLFGNTTIGPAEATLLGQELVHKSILKHQRLRDDEYRRLATVEMSSSLHLSQTDHATRAQLNQVRNQSGRPRAGENLYLAGTMHSGVKLARSNSSSSVSSEEEEELDPFRTHVKFYDKTTLINPFQCKMDLVRVFNVHANSIDRLAADIDLLEQREVSRIVDVYNQSSARDLNSKSKQSLHSSASQMIGSLSGTGGILPDQVVMLPCFEERPVGPYKIDLLLYASVVTGRRLV